VNKKEYLFVVIIITILIGSCGPIKDSSIRIDRGILNMQDWSEDNIINLNGNWLTYEGFIDEPIDPANYQGEVYYSSPSESWKKIGISDDALVSYQLKLSDMRAGVPLVIFIPFNRYYIEVLVNGKVIDKAGRYDPANGTFERAMFAYTVSYIPDTKDAVLVVRVANFNNKRTGFRGDIKLGTGYSIYLNMIIHIFLQFIIMGGLFALAIHHIIIFAFRRQNISSLIFAVIAGLYGIRSSIIDFGMINIFLPFIDNIFFEKIEFLSFIIPLALFSPLFYRTTGLTFFRFTTPFYYLLVLISGVIMIFFPLSVFQSYGLIPVFIMGFLLAISVLAGLIIKVSSGEKQYLVLIPGIALIIGTIINDFLSVYEVIYSTQITAFGIFFFIFSFSLLNYKQFSDSFTRLDGLKKELIEKDKEIVESKHDLELKVAIKTLEYEKKNSELELALNSLNNMQVYIQKKNRIQAMEFEATQIAVNIKDPLDFIGKFSGMAFDQSKLLEQTLRNDRSVVLIKNINMSLLKIREYCGKAVSVASSMVFHNNEKSASFELHDISSLIDETLTFTMNQFFVEKGYINIDISKDYLIENSDNRVPIVISEMKKVFANIFNNSFYELFRRKNTDSSFIPSIVIAISRAEKSLKISIKDNGSGVKDDDRSKLFMPFFTNKPSGDGIGLGLPKCYDIIVNLHKGNIIIDSEYGVFTEVIIIIPCSDIILQ